MHIRRIIALILVIIVIAIAAPVSYRAALQSKESGDKKGIQLIEMWQIDGFEGGKGSRASYLSRAAEKCFEGQNIYFKVTSLTADAARANISSGRAPDLISYSAGFYGIEELVNEKYPAYTWCSGRYCLISLDASADFSDANSENTVINEGKDNLVGVCAALEGFGEADSESSVNAYLKLLDGSYKYLLGTQRDIFRFISREVEYCVKPLTAFNDLYQNDKHIIITSDRPPKEIAQLEERLRTRFEWGLTEEIKPPDLETRIAILKRKAAGQNFFLTDDVAYFIAKNVQSNVRDMEGLLNKVIFYSSLTGSLVDSIQSAQEALRDYIQINKESIDANDIINTTARFYNVTPADIIGKRRTKEVVEPRMIAIYLIRDLLNIPLQSIGEIFGGRDHTTIINARDKIEDQLKSNSHVQNAVKDIKDMLYRR